MNNFELFDTLSLMKTRSFTLFLFALLLQNFLAAQPNCMIPPNKVTPTEAQIVYQQMETIGFLHFTINTFYDREWGQGDENPQMFNPTKLDAIQWVKIAKAAGLKELILTAKHHDGFCLWPSAFTEHSVKNSPYKDGKGDIVREFTDACHQYGIRVGLYLSPWDRNHADYGKPAYITYYKNQLTELLTNYGTISEIWFDGANGGDGYYGGANEKRIIGKDYYPWTEIQTLVKKLQPDCLIFSDAGPDQRWVGNEAGSCGETFWSAIDPSKLVIGAADCAYLNTGDPNGNSWITGQCDVSIRPGWFYHETENDKVKSAATLTDIYYKSVGRNGLMLINLPVAPTGLIYKTDSANIIAFRNVLNETFSHNLATNARVNTSSIWTADDCYSPKNITDNQQQSFWAAAENSHSAVIEFDFGKEITFDRILLQEPIAFGQRISEFEILVLLDKEWKSISKATTIGYKRLLRCDKMTSSRIKIHIINAINTPAISEFGLFLASERE